MKAKGLAVLVALFFLLFPGFAQEKAKEEGGGSSSSQESIPTEKGEGEEQKEGNQEEWNQVLELLLRIEEDMNGVSSLFTQMKSISKKKEEGRLLQGRIENALLESEEKQQRILRDIEEVIQLALSNASSSGSGGGRRGSQNSKSREQEKSRREREEGKGINKGKEEEEKTLNNGKVREEGEQRRAEKLPEQPLGTGTDDKSYGDWGKLQRKLWEEFRNMPRGVNLDKIPPEYREKLIEYSKKLSGSKEK